MLVLMKPNISAFSQEWHSVQHMCRNNLLDGKVQGIKCKKEMDIISTFQQ